MSCDICGSSACTTSFHSLEEQELYADVIATFDKARELREQVRVEDAKCEHKNKECVYESDDGEFERWRCKDCGETWGVEVAQ